MPHFFIDSKNIIKDKILINDNENYLAGDKYSLNPFSFVILCHKNDINEKQQQKSSEIHLLKGRDSR